MYKIGLSTCDKEITSNLFASYQKAGIDVIEISPKQNKYDEVNYAEISKYAKEYSIELWSFHLPYAYFLDIDISDKNLTQKTVRYYKELINKASSIGIKKFIVHSSNEPIEEKNRAERIKCAKDGLAEIAEFALKYDSVIAIEDLPRTCLGRDSSEILELISAHPELRVCFDTNHLLNEAPVDFINKINEKIITMHVSDYDFINERHWLPGEGKNDWKGILKALNNINYKGVWLYEIGFGCPGTIIRDRKLTCEDFVRNAKELFANKTPTVFSVPKPNLGMWE